MHVKAKLRIVYCERLSNWLTGLKHEKICSLLYDNKTIFFINFDIEGFFSYGTSKKSYPLKLSLGL